MLFGLANPARFMAVSRPVAPVLGAAAAVLLAVGVWRGLSAPEDYQQHDTIRILFVHVPAVFMGMFGWLCLAGAGFSGLVFRHALADAAARAVAPIGATFTAMGLVTGSIWGRPEWGTWWVWDARLTSFLILFLMYAAWMALVSSFDDEARGARMGAILALVGLVMLPVIHYSVVWWNSLHQGETLLRRGGSGLDRAYTAPLLLMLGGYFALFLTLWLVRTRAEVWRRRAGALVAAGAPA
ncbi:MAG: cytochrome c biogenesis protein CcsA [Caulobacteraceae bacterium]|nr:cytochrome c biogenesis protein CcsA [Caulobacter sp.]